MSVHIFAGHILAGGPGPAMFLGSSIMSFALPYGAFIVVASALFVLFRAKHASPRLRYLSPELVTSVTTREPGPVPAPTAAPSASGPAPSPSGTDDTGPDEASGEDTPGSTG